MDSLAQRIANFLGSGWAIGGFGLWLIIHNLVARDYVTFISDLAIEIGLMILRAESIESAAMHKDVKKIKSRVKK
jgi:hypothetical protein